MLPLAETPYNPEGIICSLAILLHTPEQTLRSEKFLLTPENYSDLEPVMAALHVSFPPEVQSTISPMMLAFCLGMSLGPMQFGNFDASCRQGGDLHLSVTGNEALGSIRFIVHDGETAAYHAAQPKEGLYS